MIKKLTIAAALVFSLICCTKENLTQIPLAVTLDSMCFDGTNYTVWYTAHKLQHAPLYAKFLVGHDTLSKKLLPPHIGNGRFLLGTGESGCGGRIRFENGTFWSSTNGNCKPCDK